ncbi:unnamed protein product [Arabis nemorensis]|uniref:F-box associated domain-containing protein n=1 Tax=Arabis nemorensis TaxID=586526 RepID=A0A565ASZ5_9BRAS|nr:unnamed protein product [Arabis nemorensis]
MMRCTNRSIRSHIFDDPTFEIRYFSRVGSNPPFLVRPSSTPRQWSLLRRKSPHNKFRFLDHHLSDDPSYKTTSTAFAVDQIDRTTQRFIIVCVIKLVSLSYIRTYRFKINAGDSWRLSKTRIPCSASEFMKPVYLDGTFHWLKEDGRSIIAFNHETEQARRIPIKFHRKRDTKLLLGASDDHQLTLISAREEEAISVFALENNSLTDPKWILVRLIEFEAVQQSKQLYWNVEVFDGKCLLVRTMKDQDNDTLVHGYDLRANKWEVVGLIPGWCDANRDFYQFKPS